MHSHAAGHIRCDYRDSVSEKGISAEKSTIKLEFTAFSTILLMHMNSAANKNMLQNLEILSPDILYT